MSKIILPHQVVDKQLKDHGLDGYIDPGTGLLLPRSAESERIIRERLEGILTARQIHASNNTGTET
jgi:hypothetical protein